MKAKNFLLLKITNASSYAPPVLIDSPTCTILSRFLVVSTKADQVSAQRLKQSNL